MIEEFEKVVFKSSSENQGIPHYSITHLVLNPTVTSGASHTHKHLTAIKSGNNDNIWKEHW
jgi:hypothetical protein